MAKVSCLRFVIPKFATTLSSFYSVTVPNVLRRSQVNYFVNKRRFCSSLPKLKKETVNVIFLDRDGERILTKAEVGNNLLTVAIDHDVELEVTIYFVGQDGTKLQVKSPIGDNLLDIIVDNDLDIDGFGACEGTLACSTCHLIFKKADYDKIPDKPTDEELDMLDLAYGLTDTSRLGCQVIVTKDMDGMEVIVPSGTADARSPS